MFKVGDVIIPNERYNPKIWTKTNPSLYLGDIKVTRVTNTVYILSAVTHEGKLISWNATKHSLDAQFKKKTKIKLLKVSRV